MVDGSATTDADARRPAAESRRRAQTVSDLQRLLALLFPDPPSLDCITVDDIQRRYPLTGLGALALTAIEQSQRIVRARGDYGQLGVCEFHIGLIYFNWADPRAAANQFLLARQSWTLAGDHPAKCLGHFAQGLALAEALHYEPAMLQYGRAERLLSQPPRHGPAATRHGALEESMRPLLLAAQAAARAKLWGNDGREPGQSAEGASFAGGAASAGGASFAGGAASDAPPRHRPSASEDADSAGRGQSAHPQMRMDDAGRTQSAQPQMRTDDASSAQSAQPQMRTDDALPLSAANISNLSLAPRRNCPIPGHTLDDDRYAWYAVADRHGGFLSSIVPGIWLLADNDVDDVAIGRVLVIVGSRQAGLGSISLRPFGQPSVTLSLYLGVRVSGSAGASAGSPIALPQLYLNEKSPISSSDVQVLAVVRGLWRLLDEQRPAVLP